LFVKFHKYLEQLNTSYSLAKFLSVNSDIPFIQLSRDIE